MALLLRKLLIIVVILVLMLKFTLEEVTHAMELKTFPPQ